MKSHQTAINLQENKNTINKDFILNSLPQNNTTRWVAKRKAQVVEAVRQRILTLDEACKRYSLSVEEFVMWQRQFDQRGVKGLSITKNKR